MTRSGVLLASAAVLAAILTTGGTASAQEQQRAQAAAASLPPALQAAIQSGNPDAVSRAIATLSAGNPQRAGALAEATIAAAERLMNSDPQAAVKVATAAVGSIRSDSVQQGAPASAQNVVTTAARILAQPAVQRLPADTVSNAGWELRFPIWRRDWPAHWRQ